MADTIGKFMKPVNHSLTVKDVVTPPIVSPFVEPNDTNHLHPGKQPVPTLSSPNIVNTQQPPPLREPIEIPFQEPPPLSSPHPPRLQSDDPDNVYFDHPGRNAMPDEFIVPVQPDNREFSAHVRSPQYPSDSTHPGFNNDQLQFVQPNGSGSTIGLPSYVDSTDDYSLNVMRSSLSGALNSVIVDDNIRHDPTDRRDPLSNWTGSIMFNDNIATEHADHSLPPNKNVNDIQDAQRLSAVSDQSGSNITFNDAIVSDHSVHSLPHDKDDSVLSGSQRGTQIFGQRVGDVISFDEAKVNLHDHMQWTSPTRWPRDINDRTVSVFPSSSVASVVDQVGSSIVFPVDRATDHPDHIPQLNKLDTSLSADPTLNISASINDDEGNSIQFTINPPITSEANFRVRGRDVRFSGLQVPYHPESGSLPGHQHTQALDDVADAEARLTLGDIPYPLTEAETPISYAQAQLAAAKTSVSAFMHDVLPKGWYWSGIPKRNAETLPGMTTLVSHSRNDAIKEQNDVEDAYTGRDTSELPSMRSISYAVPIKDEYSGLKSYSKNVFDAGTKTLDETIGKLDTQLPVERHSEKNQTFLSGGNLSELWNDRYIISGLEKIDIKSEEEYSVDTLVDENFQIQQEYNSSLAEISKFKVVSGSDDFQYINKKFDGLITLKFKDIRTKEEIEFESYITNISEDLSPQWSQDHYFGRVDPMMTYRGTTRNVTLNFKIVCESESTLKEYYKRLNTLTGMVYPQYNGSLMYRGPVVEMTVGDLIKTDDGGQTGVIQNLNFDYSESTWQILERDKDPIQVPFLINVSLSIVALHKDAPGMSLNSKVFGVQMNDGKMSPQKFRNVWKDKFENKDMGAAPKTTTAKSPPSSTTKVKPGAVKDTSKIMGPPRKVVKTAEEAYRADLADFPGT